MWALLPLAMLLGGSFKPGGVGLGDEGVVEGWGEFRGKFGQGFPCLDTVFMMEMLLGDSFGTCEEVLGGEGGLESEGDRERNLVRDSPVWWQIFPWQCR